MNKLFKIIIIAPIVLVLLLMLLVIVLMKMDGRIDYDVAIDDSKIPLFTEMEIPFEHKLNPDESLPFLASAVIDVDNDGTEELFIGGGPNQKDKFFRFEKGAFVDISSKYGLKKTAITEATFGASVVDFDKNGFTDLIISRTNGVWLYSNDGSQFTESKLDLPLHADSTPLSVGISDINRDGFVDLYVSGYIKKELTEGQSIFREGYGGISTMALNNGDNTFSDITKSSGLYSIHNTFMGIFVDIDNDGLEDLVVAQDTGHVKTYKNKGNNKFVNTLNPDSVRFSYPMGIGVSDYNNDGLVDFFFSNVGTSAPEFLVRGDLTDEQEFNTKWIMFENKGDFKFEDVAEKVKLADYEFSWGAIFEDFNLDGLDDLVVSENYIGLPTYNYKFLRAPGRFLIQNEQSQFAAVGEKSGVVNKRYSISPITADFNQDGYPDLVHVNLAGTSKAFISKGGKSNYLKVKLPNTIESIAAKIKVTLDNGKIIYRDYISGEGLMSDQSHVQIFGLNGAKASAIQVKYINGKEENESGVFRNQTIQF
ncbi:MAG: VCBS repeat-containing protein [Cocleimonas sp.]